MQAPCACEVCRVLAAAASEQVVCNTSGMRVIVQRLGRDTSGSLARHVQAFSCEVDL